MPSAILFMCGMNAIRSPMAEAMARSILPSGTYIDVGRRRAGERDPFVDIVLEEDRPDAQAQAAADAG